MNWEDLKYFLALADLRTLSATARHLGVTHATVSRRIRQLERGIGTPLFDQQPDGFVLTARGHAVQAQALQMDRHVTAIADLSGQGELSGLVRISATPALSAFLVAEILPALRLAYPKLSLEVLAEMRNLNLARHEAHLSLRLARPITGEFVIRKLCDLRYGLFISSKIPEEDVGSLDKVDYTDDYEALPEQVWMDQVFPKTPSILRTNSLSNIKQAIQAGLGFGLLPLYLVSEKDGLRRLPVADPIPDREIWLVMRQSLSDVSRVRAVADFFNTSFMSHRPLFEMGATVKHSSDLPEMSSEK